jgi:hypothetical protein
MIKHYKLPDNTSCPYEVMAAEDVPGAHALLTTYLADRLVRALPCTCVL